MIETEIPEYKETTIGCICGGEIVELDEGVFECESCLLQYHDEDKVIME